MGVASTYASRWTVRFTDRPGGRSIYGVEKCKTEAGGQADRQTDREWSKMGDF